MIGAETGIIGHLRAGSSRNADARLPTSSAAAGPTPISSFLRRQSFAQSKVPPVKAASPLSIAFKSPSLKGLGLKSPMLRSQAPLGLTSSQSKFAWMNKSFLSNLRRLLDDSEEIGGVMKEAISWNATGDAFALRDKAVFATHLAPKYFSIMSVSTFRMVAQSWGFSLQVDPTTRVETYQHATFVKSDPSICQRATMREMKESSSDLPSSISLEPPPRQEESNDTKSGPKQEEDPLLLLAATASASAEHTNQESTPNTLASKAPEENKINTKTVSTEPFVANARRTSLSSVLSASASRKTSLGFKMPPGNPLRTSVEQTLNPSDATSATLELLKSRRKSFDNNSAGLSRLRMPSASVGPRNPLAAMGGAAKLTGSPLGQLEKRVRLLKAQASLTATLQLLTDDPIATTPDRPFLENLRAILEQAEQDRFTHIISWMKHGRSFRIYHENEFTQVVYPRLTNGTPLTNVEDLLKEFGFIKLAKGREKEAYFHPLFVRDLPMLGRGKTIQQWKAAGWKGDSTPEFFL